MVLPNASSQSGTSEMSQEEQKHSKNSGWGGKRKEIWSLEATETIIQLVKDNDKRLNDRKTKKSVIWRDITEAMQPLVNKYIS
ncbi:hypothetical protein E2C01_096921 [Portunus trituberculatus]|uniref:Regulatory protein zeste n=1 Tax=Portunus trituberculatus TaxID=210409 RepID=A0A5B7K3A6_PORTR|nr:hypothetical protein [Portunus trituberculatus]